MSDNEGCGGCLNTMAAVVGILSGLITIIAFFGKDADSLLEAAGEYIPSISGFLDGLAGQVRALVADVPYAQWVTAIGLFVIIFAVRYVVEKVFDLITTDVEAQDIFVQVLAYLPLALLWVWTFSGVMSTLGLVLFFVGYLVSIVGSVYVISEFT